MSVTVLGLNRVVWSGSALLLRHVYLLVSIALHLVSITLLGVNTIVWSGSTQFAQACLSHYFWCLSHFFKLLMPVCHITLDICNITLGKYSSLICHTICSGLNISLVWVSITLLRVNKESDVGLHYLLRSVWYNTIRTCNITEWIQ